MSQRLAPVLAIVFMSKIEEPVMECRPLLYCHYIDDCFIVCATQNEMDMCFELLNQQAEHIKLTRVKPTDNWSAHPSQTKRATIKNVFRTAAAVFSDSDLKSAHPSQTKRATIKNMFRTAAAVSSDSDLNTEVRNCIRKAGLDSMVRMIEVPPANLKARLVRNRLYDSCCVVYLIKCMGCNGEYIGETGRPLGERVKEHLGVLRRCDIAGPLGEHRLRCHNGAGIDVAVTILAREFEISARKTLEALWIAARNPTINRKEERVPVIQELAPYVDLCGLEPEDSLLEAR
ncbi:unnamed protein product [Heligmosomoides polygyrus]|uniref:Reverse transcriptase domain-containing protein n=1 Tax=Heligmosomoides polygyrus TaxID=6339 RepID=A0A183GAC1_HELPZ|nr:unnamed protein product [Heligmosomoides polygyrus]